LGIQYASREHFFTFAAKVMRRILLDYARRDLAHKRGQGAEHSLFSTQQRVIVNFNAGGLRLFMAPGDPSHLPLLEHAAKLVRERPHEMRSYRDAVLMSLGQSYTALKRYREAEGVLLEAAAIERNNAGLRARLLETLDSLGRVSRFLGRLDEDERYHYEAYQVSLQEVGPNLSSFARATWAYALANTGKFEQAARESEGALETHRKRTQRPVFNCGLPWQPRLIPIFAAESSLPPRPMRGRLPP